MKEDHQQSIATSDIVDERFVISGDAERSGEPGIILCIEGMLWIPKKKAGFSPCGSL